MRWLAWTHPTLRSCVADTRENQVAESGLCTSCGTALPDADALGLITCPGCGAVSKLPGSTPTLGDAGPPPSGPPPEVPMAPDAGPPPPAPTLQGWPAPPVAAPSPASQWGQPASVAGAPPTSPPPKAGKGKKGKRKATSELGPGGKVGCAIVPIAIFLVIVFAIVGAVRSCDVDTFSSTTGSDFDTAKLTLSGGGSLLPSEGDDADFVTILQDTEDSQTTRSIARIRFSGDSSELLWQSEPVDENAYRVEVAEVDGTLFAGIDDELYALDAETGETQWTTTLRDKLTSGCVECFAAVDGHLVVRTTDAYLTAFGTRSAEPAWSKRLVSVSGSMSVVDDRLFVVDEPESSDSPTPVLLVDPATGKTIRATTPTCPKGSQTPWDLALSPGDEIRPVPNSKDVMAVFGFGDTCVVRWDPATSAIKWTSRLTGLSTYDEEEVVAGVDDLVFGGAGEVLITVDVHSGKARQLEVSGDDVDATPSQIVGRTLVALTVTTRGTPKGGMAAWDLETGERLWANASLGTAQPVSSSRYHSSDALFDGTPRSLLVPVGDGLNSFVFEGTDRTFTVAPVDLETGELGTQVRRGFITRYDSGTVSLTIEGQTEDRLMVSIDNLLQSLPVSGKGDVVSYPEKN